MTEPGVEGRRREDRLPVSVLLVSPNAKLRAELRERLHPPRWLVVEALTGAAALEYLEESESEVLLLDPLLPDLQAVEFTAMVQQRFPHVQVLTVHAPMGQLQLGSASPTAVSSQLSELFFRTGSKFSLAPDAAALTRIDGPFDGVGSDSGSPERVGSLDAEAVSIDGFAGGGPTAGVFEAPRPGGRGDAPPRPRVLGRPGIRGMVGASEPMLRVYELAHMVAARDTTVVVTGESGTGKDLVAQAVHLLSPRQKQPFVVINCAAIPEPLLEAELFGYVKGSFTGATQSRIGRIHAAHGGTLFLDEIGDMPLALQSKILRFLEQGEVQRLGGNDNLKVDVRVIAATNADLKASVERHLFREDLYYRLMVFPIPMPPLRARMDDLAALAESFLAKFTPGAALTTDALAALERHGWPGNVRELRNVMERATILAGDAREIGLRHIVI